MLASQFQHYLRSGFSLGKGGKLFQDAERQILKLIFWQPDMTQSKISEQANIPQQTVSRMINSLIDNGVLNQGNEPINRTRGKPAFALSCNPDFAYSFGLSILIEAIAVTIMNFKGEVIGSRFCHMQDMSINNVLKQANLLLDELVAERQINEDKVLGMGVGISGFFSSNDGKMNTHKFLDDWSYINISQLVSEHFGLPVWAVNDGTGAAAGEGIVGIGRRYKNFVYLFVSTALGGGLISNNEILEGTFGNAGELGDMLPPKLYSHPNLALLRHILLKNGIEISSIYELKDNFDVNWPGVDEWMYRVQESFDLIATCSSALLDTQAIIIGGHIPRALTEKLIPRIEVYAQYRRGAKRPQPDIIAAGVTENPVAVGAASLPIRNLCL